MDADLVRFFLENGGPIPGQGGLFVYLVDGFLPLGLVAQLAAQGAEALIGYDVPRSEVLELDGIGPGFFG